MKKQPKRKNQRRNSTAMFIGVGIIGVAVLLLFMKDLIPTKKPSEEKMATTDDIATRFRADGELTFYTPAGKPLAPIEIEIAETEEQRTQGMMGRKSMAANRGMLFIFPNEELRSFWMMNTPLPLDIIFVDAKRTIVKIHENTAPYSDASLPSERPAQYTVEVNAGFCTQHGITEGCTIEWRRR